MSEWLHWLENNMLGCPARELTGFDCPGCGFQRAFIALVRGELWQSLKLYPPLIPFLSTWLLLFAHLLFRFRHGARWIKYLFIATASLILINFVVKTSIHFSHDKKQQHATERSLR